MKLLVFDNNVVSFILIFTTLDLINWVDHIKITKKINKVHVICMIYLCAAIILLEKLSKHSHNQQTVLRLDIVYTSMYNVYYVCSWFMFYTCIRNYIIYVYCVHLFISYLALQSAGTIGNIKGLFQEMSFFISFPQQTP